MTKNSNLSDVNDSNNPIGVEGDNVLEGYTSVVDTAVPGGSQTSNKKVNVKNKRTKSTEDLPPGQLPKDYVDKVVIEYYNNDCKVKIEPKEGANVEMSSGEMSMDVNKTGVENVVLGSQVSRTNSVQSSELLNPDSMDWNMTRPFCQARARAVWSNVGKFEDKKKHIKLKENSTSILARDSFFS